MNQQQGFNPTFENGGFWEYYKDLERQFEDFLVYVPYLEGNEETYSFRLANLLLSIGAHIDSALKEIAKYSDFSIKYPEMVNPTTKKGKPRNPIITDYYPISEEYILPKQVVTFKCLPNRENIFPFENYTRQSGNNLPYWWTAYNNVKHHFDEGFKEAKLKTVRDALAGAFLLNVIFEPSTNRLEKYGIVKDKYQLVGHKKERIFSKRKFMDIQHTHVPDSNNCIIETPLFIYEYVYEKPKEPVS